MDSVEVVPSCVGLIFYSLADNVLRPGMTPLPRGRGGLQQQLDEHCRFLALWR